MEAEVQTEAVVKVEIEVEDESDENTFKNTFRFKDGEWTADLVDADGQEIKGVKLLEHDFELREEVLSLEMDAELSNSSNGVTAEGEEVTYTTTYSRTEEGIIVTHAEQPRVPEVEEPDEMLEAESPDSGGGFSLAEQAADLVEHEEVGSFAMEYTAQDGELFPLSSDNADGTKAEVAFSAGLTDEQREEHQTATTEAINGGMGTTEIRGLEGHTDTAEVYVISEYVKVGATAEGLPVVQVTSHLETRQIPELTEQKIETDATDSPTSGGGIEITQTTVDLSSASMSEATSTAIPEQSSPAIAPAKPEVATIQQPESVIESVIVEAAAPEASIGVPIEHAGFGKIDTSVINQPALEDESIQPSTESSSIAHQESSNLVQSEASAVITDLQTTLETPPRVSVEHSGNGRFETPVVTKTQFSTTPSIGVRPNIESVHMNQAFEKIDSVLPVQATIESTTTVAYESKLANLDTLVTLKPNTETSIPPAHTVLSPPELTTATRESQSGTELSHIEQSTPIIVESVEPSRVEAAAEVTTKFEASDTMLMDEKIEVQIEATDLTASLNFSEPVTSQVAVRNETPKSELSVPVQAAAEVIQTLPAKRVEISAAPIQPEPSREVDSAFVEAKIHVAPTISSEPRQIAEEPALVAEQVVVQGDGPEHTSDGSDTGSAEETGGVRQTEEVLAEAYEAAIETPPTIQTPKSVLKTAAVVRESRLGDFGASSVPETNNTWRAPLETDLPSVAPIEQAASPSRFVSAGDNTDTDDLEITFGTDVGSTSKRRPRRTRTAAA